MVGAALPQQTVGGIDADAEARAAQMMTRDVAQYGQQQTERHTIAGDADVPVERVEEPQRRVGGVVDAGVLALGKEVRDQAVAHVVAERAQDVPGLQMTAGRECEALERDHRVAAPVGEPVVPRDDRAHLVAGGVRACGVGDASRRRDHELVGGEHELGGHAGACSRRRGDDQAAPPLALGLASGRRRERGDDFPRLGRCDQRRLGVRRERGAEVARAHERAGVRVPAAALHAIDDLLDPARLDGERGLLAVEQQAQRRQHRGPVDFVAVVGGGHRVHALERGRYRRLVEPEVQRRTQHDAQRCGAVHEAPAHMDGVLSMQ